MCAGCRGYWGGTLEGPNFFLRPKYFPWPVASGNNVTMGQKKNMYWYVNKNKKVHKQGMTPVIDMKTDKMCDCN